MQTSPPPAWPSPPQLHCSQSENRGCSKLDAVHCIEIWIVLRGHAKWTKVWIQVDYFIPGWFGWGRAWQSVLLSAFECKGSHCNFTQYSLILKVKGLHFNGGRNLHSARTQHWLFSANEKSLPCSFSKPGLWMLFVLPPLSSPHTIS